MIFKRLLLLGTVLCPFFLHAQFTFDIEGNYIASIRYNEVRTPASGGTYFDLSKDLQVSTDFTYRLRASYTIVGRHVVSALYAPLTIRSSGSFTQPVRYDDQVFATQAPVEATYKFNSYRLTYRYMIVTNDRWKLGLGLTGKVRDANISLSQGSKTADYPNLGIVPLVNFYAAWSPVKKFSLLLEGDALATGQGRAEDIFGGVTYAFTDHLGVKAGYRILEGGANVEKNYNFTWVNYLALGVLVSF